MAQPGASLCQQGGAASGGQRGAAVLAGGARRGLVGGRSGQSVGIQRPGKGGRGTVCDYSLLIVHARSGGEFYPGIGVLHT